MKSPPLYQIAEASPAVRALLGDPPRLYEYGDQGDEKNQPLRPYVVWQQVGGAPENYLGDTPDIDSDSLQIDIYAHDSESLKATLAALVAAIEPHAHIVGWGPRYVDPDTRDYVASFSVDWFVDR